MRKQRNANKNIIPVILGPTSSGKTSLAVEICKKMEAAQILSCDSRQIYKYMDIGTGKMPLGSNFKITKGDTHWILEGVDIYGYDLALPDELYSVYDYANYALPKVKEGIGNKITTFIVGGTGFYADILTGRVKPSAIKPDLELRKTLKNESLVNLQKQLTSLNLESFKKIDVKNKIRLIRAVEIELLKENKNTPLPYLTDVEFVYFGLTAPREILFKSTNTWLDYVWKNGLIDEVNKLFKLGFKNSPKLHGLVYKSAVDYIDGRLSEDEAVQRAKFDLHAYIRRQQTWFKKNTEIKWFDINSTPRAEIIADILKELNY